MFIVTLSEIGENVSVLGIEGVMNTIKQVWLKKRNTLGPDMTPNQVWQ